MSAPACLNVKVLFLMRLVSCSFKALRFHQVMKNISLMFMKPGELLVYMYIKIS